MCEALLALDIADLTVTEAHGFGRQNGHTTLYPDTGQPIDLLPKAKIELMVASERLCEVVACIENGSKWLFLSLTRLRHATWSDFWGLIEVPNRL